MSMGAWWTAALSESVRAGQALGVVCDGQQVALYRDAQGAVHALEDRCPHRRVLLSPGVVRPGGLQCPYHGWTFDGASGRCTDIPNLRRDEPIPPKYQALAYPVLERHGFIHVWTAQGIPARRLAVDDHPGREQDRICGAAVLPIPAEEYLNILLDGPQCLLRFPGVDISDALLGDLRVEGRWAVLDRGALWKGKGERSAFVRDHPLIVRASVALDRTAASVELLDEAELPLVTLFIGVTANRRGTTGVCWRARTHRGADMPLRVWLRRMLGARPVTVLRQLDGAAIAALEAAPSWDLANIIQRSAA